MTPIGHCSSTRTSGCGTSRTMRSGSRGKSSRSSNGRMNAETFRCRRSRSGRSLFSRKLADWNSRKRTDLGGTGPFLPGVQLKGLTPSIAIESTRLPGELHRDPADRILIATARLTGAALVTSDDRILNYARPGDVRVINASPLTCLRSLRSASAPCSCHNSRSSQTCPSHLEHGSGPTRFVRCSASEGWARSIARATRG